MVLSLELTHLAMQLLDFIFVHRLLGPQLLSSGHLLFDFFLKLRLSNGDKLHASIRNYANRTCCCCIFSARTFNLSTTFCVSLNFFSYDSARPVA